MAIIYLVMFLLAGVLGQVHAEIRISEVYPAPATGYEWVEICNASTEPVSLTSYTMHDSAGKTIHMPQITLEPNQYVLATASAVLNNGGDTVYLRKNNVIVETMIYDQTVSSTESYVSCNAVWSITSDVTPGFQNPLCEGTPTPVEGIEDGVESSENSEITTLLPTIKPTQYSILPTHLLPTQSPSTIPSPQLFTQKHQPYKVLGTTTSPTVIQQPTDIIIPGHSVQKEKSHVLMMLTTLVSASITGYLIYKVARKIKDSYNEIHDT